MLLGFFDEKIVEELFAQSKHQGEVILALYRMAIPDFDKVKEIDGYPVKISEATNKELFRLFIEFDKKHHPDVVAGGGWLNKGFSTQDEEGSILPLESELLIWEYAVDESKLIYEEK